MSISDYELRKALDELRLRFSILFHIDHLGYSLKKTRKGTMVLHLDARLRPIPKEPKIEDI